MAGASSAAISEIAFPIVSVALPDGRFRVVCQHACGAVSVVLADHDLLAAGDGVSGLTAERTATPDHLVALAVAALGGGPSKGLLSGARTATQPGGSAMLAAALLAAMVKIERMERANETR